MHDLHMHDRLVDLLGVFSTAGWAKDGRPGTRALSEISGLPYLLLSPRYPSKRKQETIDKIVTAAAGLLGIEVNALNRWLAGDDVSEVQQQISAAELRQCASCKEWFLREIVDKALCRCPTCLRSPGINAWVAKVDQQIAKAPAWLQTAWSVARADGKALTYRRLATLARRSPDELRAAWRAAHLPDRPAGQAVKSMLHNHC